MTDEESRARARAHTARLLRMLRGPAGKPAEAPGPAAPASNVTEAAPVYDRRPPAKPASPPTPAPVAPRSGVIPTVGESLRAGPGVLGEMVARARRLKQLSQIFYAYLPLPLREHVVLVRLDAEAWEVQTDTALWATRLRYLLPSIQQPLGQQLELNLPKPQIRVEPSIAPAVRRLRPRPSLSQRSAEQIESLARTVNDPDLSAALRRLAAHGRSDSAADR